jgi:hypothetical protein
VAKIGPDPLNRFERFEITDMDNAQKETVETVPGVGACFRQRAKTSV